MCRLLVGTKPALMGKCSAEANIVDNDASVSLLQEFQNPCFKLTADADEAVYNFPLQSTAAVYSFTTKYLDENGKVLKTFEGKAKEKQEAREEYEQAKANGKSAQLLEVDSQNSSDVFVVSIGIISKECKTVQVCVKYFVELTSEEGSKVKRFTLPAVVAQRYGDKVKSNFTEENVSLKGFKFSFNANVSLSQNLSLLECPTHSVSTKLMKDGSPKMASVELSSEDEVLSKDLVIKVGKQGKESSMLVQDPSTLGASFVEHFGESSIVKFDFHIEQQGKAEQLGDKKEFIFLVDRSGSMSGSSMNNCKKALQLCLSSLPENCSFNICSFGSRFTYLFNSGSETYSEKSLTKARQHIDSMTANMGGTEILSPMKDILGKRSKSSKVKTVLFLLTDGQVGNTQSVIDFVKNSHKENGTQVFSCGIGSGVSQHLVDGVAKAGNGTSTFMAYGERMNAKLAKQMGQARSGALSKLRLDLGNLTLSDSKLSWDAKSSLPETTFDGETVSLFFAVHTKSLIDLKDNTSTVTLFGSSKKEEFEIAKVKVSDALMVQGNLVVPALRQQVLLVEEGNDKKSARKKATKLAVCANIVTKYTSLVSVEVGENGEEVPAKEVNVISINAPVQVPLAPPPMMMQFSAAPRREMMRKSAPLGAMPGGGGMLNMLGSAMGVKKKKGKAAKKKSKKYGGGFLRGATSAAPKMALRDKVAAPRMRMEVEELAMARPAMASLMDDEEELSYEMDEGTSMAMPEVKSLDLSFATEEKETVSKKEVERSSAVAALKMSKFDVLDVFIKLQKPNGSFSKSVELFQALNTSSTTSDVKKLDADIFLTAVVCAYMEKHLGDMRDEWELLFNKAQQWMKSTSEVKELEQLKKDAAQFLLTLK